MEVDEDSDLVLDLRPDGTKVVAAEDEGLEEEAEAWDEVVEVLRGSLAGRIGRESWDSHLAREEYVG